MRNPAYGLRLTTSVLRRLVAAALREDLGERGDVTSLAVIPPPHRSVARIVARESGVLCGVEVAAEGFRQRDRAVRLTLRARDGSRLKRGQVVLEIRGRTRGILSAERVALNFLQRLSGIATLTSRFVRNANRPVRSQKSEARSQNVRILDTRKTTPLLRALEKYAVRCGGGMNHRAGLHDMVLIKDNHLAALTSIHPLPMRKTLQRFRVTIVTRKCSIQSPIREAVQRARRRWPRLKVEVECDTLAQVRDAMEARADMILLDNMSIAQMRRAVRLAQGKVPLGRGMKGRPKLEASGGITLERVSAIARTGVDYISVGALTHSAHAMDFSLEVKDNLARPALRRSPSRRSALA